MIPRIERLRLRALAQGMINVDEGPEDEQRVREESEAVGVTYDDLCDQIEEFLDADEE